MSWRGRSPASSPATDRPGHLERGLAEASAGHLRRARRSLAAAIRAGGPNLSRACPELVRTCLRAGGPAAAGAEIRSLLPPGSPWLLFSLGYLSRLGGRLAEAKRRLQSALSRQPGLPAALAELGWVLCLEGDAGGGSRLLARAERALRARRDAWGLATVLSHRANLAMLRFRLGEAVRRFEQAARWKRRSGELVGLGSALLNAGLVHYQLCDFRRAIVLLLEALAVQTRCRDRLGAARTWNGLGLCQRVLHDDDRAADSFRRALALFRRLGDDRGQVAARWNLGFTLHRLGKTAAAQRELGRAVAALSLIPASDDLGAGGGVADLARFQTEGGRPALALRTIAGFAGRIPTGSPRTAMLLEVERARAHLRLGDPAAARAAAARALAAGQGSTRSRGQLAYELIEAQALLAAAALALGDAGLAAGLARRALRRVKSLLPEHPGASLRMGVLGLAREIDDTLVLARLRSGNARAAWDAAAEAKARTLASGSTASAAGRRRLALEAEIRALAASPRLSRSDRRRRRELRRRYLWATDAESGGPRARQRTGPPLSRAALSAHLGSRSALVEFHVTRDTTIVFVVTGAGLAATTVPHGGQSIDRAVSRLLAVFDDAAASLDPRPHLDRFDVGLCRRLYRRLLHPALRLVPGSVRRLIVVPDGALQLLPFELLCRDRAAATAAAADYLGDHFAISYARSSRLLQPPGRHRPAAPPRLVALGYAPSRPIEVEGPAGTEPLAALPGLGREIGRVAALFPRRAVRTGRRATPGEYARLAPGATVVHLAAHALPDSTAPGLSGLLLSGRGSRPDFLTADQVSRRRIGCRIVVLSGCRTALGRRRGREGIDGMVGAFLAAGAKAVLSSLWPVDDRATEQLMAAFYRRLVAGAAPADALAEAKRELRQRGRRRGSALAHPFFWAAFVLTDHQPDRSP